MNKIIAIINVIRDIIGVFFIFIGVTSIHANDICFCVLMILLGISLTHFFYKKLKIKSKFIQFIVPIIILAIGAIIVSKDIEKKVIKYDKNGKNNINIIGNNDSEYHLIEIMS